MDSLADFFPGLGDAIRVGKLSFQIGEMISKYIADKENERDYSIVTWRRIDVFLKEHPQLKEPPFLAYVLFFLTLGFGLVIYLLMVLLVFVPKLVMIKINADEIEVTNNEYKMIRKDNGNMGICQVNQENDEATLLLPSKYKIIKGFDNSYIVKNQKEKYGIYNAELKTFVAKCEYDAITLYSSKSYLSIKGEYVSLMNSKGDRI
jgi:hypothetical protein